MTDLVLLVVLGSMWFVVGFTAGADARVRQALSRLVRPLRCRMSMCPCRVVETEFGISGQCIDCGKITAFMSHRSLRQLTPP